VPRDFFYHRFLSRISISRQAEMMRVAPFFSPSRDEALYEVSSYCLLCSLENQFSVPTKVNLCTA